jgi:hypothetical protein
LSDMAIPGPTIPRRRRDGGSSRTEEGTPPPAEEKGSLIILGVIHRDPEGPALLDEWLSVVRPEVITLEFSNYGKAFREARGPHYIERIREVYNKLKNGNLPCYDNALSMAISYVEMPYEFQAVSRYGEAHGVPVHLVDMDFFSFLKLRGIEEFLGVENLEALLSRDEGDRIGSESVLARFYFEAGVRTVPYTEEMAVRDDYMSSKIRVLMKRYKRKKFLHVAGWRHLEDPRNFYGPLNPVKVFIHDKTFCI